VQASDVAARRAELARKAEEKAVAEAERLRHQAAEERSRKRQEDLDALMNLNLATDIKVGPKAVRGPPTHPSESNA
jgi:hypothetical protein